MPEIDINRLLWIVTGVQLNAEVGDRPLAYRIEKEVRGHLSELLGKPADGESAVLTPVVISDVFYLSTTEIQSRPVISVGGPGVNAVSALLSDKLPTAVAIENALVVQMDVEMSDPRCAVWGMSHIDTIRAVDLFIAKQYLEMFVKGVVDQMEK